MHLWTEAKMLAQEAWDESRKHDADPDEIIWQACDMHESVIYYHKAIRFCADQDTSEGEQWLEDSGGICQPGDTFGQIACRIAFATLYCAATAALAEIREAAEDTEGA